MRTLAGAGAVVGVMLALTLVGQVRGASLAGALMASAAEDSGAVAEMQPGTGCVPNVDTSCPTSIAAFTANCVICAVGKPTEGHFSISLPRLQTFPNNRCKIKTVSGTLDISWDGGRTSRLNVSGRYLDGKPLLRLAGNFAVDDPAWPKATASLVLENYPADACVDVTNPIRATVVIGSLTT